MMGTDGVFRTLGVSLLDPQANARLAPHFARLKMTQAKLSSFRLITLASSGVGLKIVPSISLAATGCVSLPSEPARASDGGSSSSDAAVFELNSEKAPLDPSILQVEYTAKLPYFCGAAWQCCHCFSACGKHSLHGGEQPGLEHAARLLGCAQNDWEGCHKPCNQT